jgi:hypothetical protein
MNEYRKWMDCELKMAPNGCKNCSKECFVKEMLMAGYGYNYPIWFKIPKLSWKEFSNILGIDMNTNVSNIITKLKTVFNNDGKEVILDLDDWEEV